MKALNQIPSKSVNDRVFETEDSDNVILRAGLQSYIYKCVSIIVSNVLLFCFWLGL